MKTLVFLHSTGTLPSMWRPVEVPQGFEVLRPSNLGYPPLAPLERPATATLGDELENLRSQLPTTGELHLVAHSFGALLALNLLPTLGDRVKSVVLYEPVLFGALLRSKHAAPEALADARTLFESKVLADPENAGTDTWLATFIDYWNKPGSWGRMPAAVKVATRAQGWKLFQEVGVVFSDASNFEDYRVAAPLLLIKGERSRLASRAMIDELARVNRHATVHDLEGTGHMGPLTHPALFNQAFRLMHH